MSSSLVSIYRRPDSYYLVTSAQTTTGVWADLPEPPTVVELDADALLMGRWAGELLGQAQPTIPEPSRSEWTALRRNGLRPILQAARVPNWHGFLVDVSLVSVSRLDRTFVVEPMRPTTRPRGAFKPDARQTQRFEDPTPEILGRSILDGFDAVRKR